MTCKWMKWSAWMEKKLNENLPTLKDATDGQKVVHGLRVNFHSSRDTRGLYKPRNLCRASLPGGVRTLGVDFDSDSNSERTVREDEEGTEEHRQSADSEVGK